MAATNDPRASGFDPVAFRDAIKFAMSMGLPDSVPLRATFQWTPDKTYHIADPAGKPYTWTAPPVSNVTHPDVLVDVALEFQRRSSGEGLTSVGDFQTSFVTLTLLDVDYALVQGADKVQLGGDTYFIEYVAPPVGLFSVTVYQMYCRAEDES